MTRTSATAAILLCLAFFTQSAATAQSGQDSQCFPWQEFRNGRCVAKPSQEPPPLPASPGPAVVDPCAGGARGLSGQCVCPVNTHLDTSGVCIADVAPAPPILIPAPTRGAEDNIICDGGTVTGGTCVCPAGFNVMPASGNASGGICVKTHAENCLGGELTVSGTCLCNGQVVMSGETYLLEYAKGKCLPKRCPVQTELKDGKCVALSGVSPSPEQPETKSKPSPPKEASKEAPKEASEEEGHRPHCGRGMVRTRSGCVPAHRRLPGIYIPGLAGPPFDLSRYYRNH